MRIRLGILLILLASVFACDGAFQEVKVMDRNGQPIKVLRDSSELQILAQHWSQRREKEKPANISWIFHVNIRQGGDWTTWLYHPDGWMQVLTKQRVPTYKISEPDTVNKLLGIHNNQLRSELDSFTLLPLNLHMLDPILIEAVKIITQFFIGFVGLLISIGVFLLTRQRMKDTWIRTYAEIHSTFWNDAVIQEVRCWLAYPNVYADLKSILLKRQGINKAVNEGPFLTCEEYSKLEKLDKYLSILLRAVTLNPKIFRKRDLWNALHFKYWLCACLDIDRPELIWYVQKFYSPLYTLGQKRAMREYAEKIGFRLEKRK